jgi:hypothetical protein
MKDSKDSSIPVWVLLGFTFLVLVRKDHDVGMSAGVDRVLCTAHIISRVINTEILVMIKTVVDKDDTVPIFVRE